MKGRNKTRGGEERERKDRHGIPQRDEEKKW
jgi:hypothetical protein